MKGHFAITLFPSRRNASKTPCASRDPYPRPDGSYHRVTCADTASHFPFCFAQQSTGRRRAQRFWTTIPHAYRMHVQREFPISSAASDLWVCWAGRAHAAASARIESYCAEPPCRARAAGAPHEITEDCRPGCRRLAGRRHRGGARVDQRRGSSRPDRERGGR